MSELLRTLRGLFAAVLKEAEENPAFAEKLTAMIISPGGDRSEAAPRRSMGRARGRRKPGAFDPFVVYAAGEGELRRRLQELDVERLKDIVAEHGMDTAKLAMKWKSADRLIRLVIDTVAQRSQKGEAFRASGMPTSPRRTGHESHLNE